MKKKELLKIEPAETRKKGKVITARTTDGVLCLGCHEDGKLFARYYMGKNGEHESLKDGKWSRAKLAYIYGWKSGWEQYSARRKLEFASEEDECIVLQFTECRGEGNGYAAIKHKEYRYDQEQRMCARKRKSDRIEEEMSGVPCLPDDFENWCMEVMFKDAEYMFYDKEKNVYHCTACGKKHQFKKAKQGEAKICSRTGKAPIVKKRAMKAARRERCMVLQNTRAGKQAVARHFTVEVMWDKTGKHIAAYEDVRYMLPKDHTPCHKWYYGQYAGADEFEQDWWDTNPAGKHCYMEYCYPAGAQEALAGTVYEHLGIPVMAQKGWKIYYNKIMAAYQEAGMYEYFAKGGDFERLARELSDDFTVWYGYYGDTVDTAGKDAESVLKINTQRINRLKAAGGGKCYLRWLQEEQESGKKLPEETIRKFEEYQLDPWDIRFITDRMSPVQVMNYLTRQKEATGKSMGRILELWKDYLSMAEKMGLDVSDAIVYRPKDIQLRHDQAVNILAAKDDAEEEKKLLGKYPDLNKVITDIQGKYDFEDDRFFITAPRNAIEIMQEGRNLHHCGGSSDRYYERIAHRETYILFLRRKEKPETSFYTLEMEPGGTIRQKRTFFNRQDGIEEIKGFLQAFQKEVKKRVKGQEERLAEESRQKRIEEMRQLQNSGDQRDRKLYEILKDDLMDAAG